MSGASEERRFKVLGTKPPETIPWAFAETFRQQAHRNHSQTLERLNERGGLSWEEIRTAMSGRDWHQIQHLTNDQARPVVLLVIEKWKAQQNNTIPLLPVPFDWREPGV